MGRSPWERDILPLTVGVSCDTMVSGNEKSENQTLIALRSTLPLGEGRSGDVALRLSIRSVVLLSLACLVMGGLGVVVLQATTNSQAQIDWPTLFVGDCHGFNIRTRNVGGQKVDWSWRVVAPGGPYQGGGTIPPGEWGKEAINWAVPEPLCGEYYVSALVEISTAEQSLHDSFSCSCPAPREVATLPTPIATPVPPTKTPTPIQEVLASTSTASGLPTSGGSVVFTLFMEGFLATLFALICAGARWARTKKES